MTTASPPINIESRGAVEILTLNRPDTLNALDVDMARLDDVGQAYDLALNDENRIGTTLGRHTNDFMTSFYSRTPSEMLLEYGWGGRQIDPATWKAFEMTGGPSLWGHERTWATPEVRAEARAMRLRLAAEGVREPVHVMKGNYVVSK